MKLTQNRQFQNHIHVQKRAVSSLNLFVFLTFAVALWFGSSRDFSAPIPTDGSCVWKTEILPPVGDISLKAACNAGPRALWVSRDLVNICGKVLNRSWISYNWEKKNINARSLRSILLCRSDCSTSINKY